MPAPGRPQNLSLPIQLRQVTDPSGRTPHACHSPADTCVNEPPGTPVPAGSKQATDPSEPQTTRNLSTDGNLSERPPIPQQPTHRIANHNLTNRKPGCKSPGTVPAQTHCHPSTPETHGRRCSHRTTCVTCPPHHRPARPQPTGSSPPGHLRERTPRPFNCPSQGAPQHTTDLSCRNPHEWNPPADTCVNPPAHPPVPELSPQHTGPRTATHRNGTHRPTPAERTPRHRQLPVRVAPPAGSTPVGPQPTE